MNDLIDKTHGIIRWPKKREEKQAIIEWLSLKFNYQKKYSEKEINNIIQSNHTFNDIPLLRRELISRKFLKRKNDGSKYWKIN